MTVSNPVIEGSFDFLDISRTQRAAWPEPHLAVKNSSSWSYCGPVLRTTSSPGHGSSSSDGLPDSLLDWLDSSVEGDVSPLLQPFLARANELLEQAQLSHYWITIRATKKTREYNEPRWHTDDLFFSNTDSPDRHDSLTASIRSRKLDYWRTKPTDWKVCATLLGPPTLFLPPPFQSGARILQKTIKRECEDANHVCTSIRCLGCASVADHVRHRLAEVLAQYGAQQAGVGQCAVFRVGAEHGAMHSEPCMDEGDRIFINVVPGTKKELKTLMTKWGMEFPRSWTVPLASG